MYAKPGIILVLVFALTGCELFGNEDDERSAVGLDPGRQYTYRWTMTELRADGQTEQVEDATFRVRVEKEKKRIGQYNDLIRFDVYRPGTDAVAASVFYQETTDRVFDYAYRGTGEVPPISPKRGEPAAYSPTAFFLWPQHSVLPALATPFPDSTIYREEPRVVFKLPLTLGQSWVSFSNPFYQTREISAIDTLKIGAGTFRCYRIRSELPVLDPDLEWNDWVSEDGLIQRRMIHVLERKAVDDTVIDTVIVHQHLELLSVSDH